jgi:diguanylate cyclase (GGDEF)-like protein
LVLRYVLSLVTGCDDSVEINRIFNLACVLGGIFCFLSGTESYFASLSPYLIAGNFVYTGVLFIAYYFSRFKQAFELSRGISIVTLIFGYLPVLWIFNGGTQSSIPYFIPMFASFLTISTINRKTSRPNRLATYGVILLLIAVVSGLIALEHSHPEWVYQYTDKAIQSFDIIIGMIFSVICNFLMIMAFEQMYFRQLNKTEEMAICDSMTGLYNHLFIVSRLDDEIGRSSRYHTPLSVIILDVDHFKKINDTFGHLMGDTVLKQVSRAIKSQCRTVDKIGRYGGDEFLIILPETSLENAAILAKRLQVKIESLSFDEPVELTISQGIAQYEQGESINTLIDRADTHLYSAKHSGRNQFVSA